MFRQARNDFKRRLEGSKPVLSIPVILLHLTNFTELAAGTNPTKVLKNNPHV